MSAPKPCNEGQKEISVDLAAVDEYRKLPGEEVHVMDPQQKEAVDNSDEVTEEVNLVLIPRHEHDDPEWTRAKEVELQKLRDFGTL